MSKASEEVIRLRKMTGRSQTAFGKRYDIPMRTIQNWENGVSVPPEYVLGLLSRAVNDDVRDPWAIVVADREAGIIIEEVDSVEEGMDLIEQLEREDRENGNYTPDFYEVAVVRRN